MLNVELSEFGLDLMNSGRSTFKIQHLTFDSGLAIAAEAFMNNAG
jgi:hypothetical protein